eukprot:TRINITY_DN1486_c0_g1_i1.p1 TRINITY_DN1486_c0_g1~~TRINITY_DN1486_c0_g1_i1.p1  ORF type:complete len:810 (+),score=177.59 TRINITY_DN1486_c0_g1_i1:232-2661(+)
MDKLNKELKKKLEHQQPPQSQQQLHPPEKSPSTLSELLSIATPNRPRSRSAQNPVPSGVPHNNPPNATPTSTHPWTGAVKPQPAPMPIAIARSGSSSTTPAATTTMSPTVAATHADGPQPVMLPPNYSGGTIGRSRSTSNPATDNNHAANGSSSSASSALSSSSSSTPSGGQRTSAGFNQPPHLAPANRPLPPPRASPAPSPAPSPTPSPRGPPMVPVPGLPLTNRPRSPTPPSGTPRRTLLLRQIEDVVMELNQNLSKVNLPQNRDLAAAKANAETLRALFSQFMAGGVFGASNLSNPTLPTVTTTTTTAIDPYWLDKLPQIIKVQTHWRRILAQRKFLSLVNQNPNVAKHIYRRKVVKEILTTEKTYLDGLRTLVNDYQIPLQNMAQSGKFTSITENDLATIFSNVSAILQCNEVLYKELMEGRLKGNSSVGTVFKNMGPYFRLYGQYVSSRDAAQNTLAKCKQDEAFSQFFVQKENSESILWSLLITPVQRIPRYVLLLSELLKRTSDDDAEKAKLNAAVDLIKEVADKINETKRVTDSLQKLVEIQSTLSSSSYNFVESHRIFVREGFVSYQIEDEQPTETYAYLLSDVLLLTMTGFGLLTSSTKKCIILPLVDATVTQKEASSKTISLTWEKANYMSIKLSSPDMSVVWLPDITKTINSLKSYSNPTTIDYLKPVVHYGILCRKTNMRWKKSVAIVRGGGLFILKSGEKRFEIQKQFKLSKMKLKELENNRFELIDVESNNSTAMQSENPEELKMWTSKLGHLCSSVSSTSLAALPALAPSSHSSSPGLNMILMGSQPKLHSSS